MARRAAYTEQDKARVYVVLTANEGIIKRTARETDVPENTVRRWRDEWAKNGPPSQEIVEAAAGDYVVQLEDTAHLALRRMHERLSSEDKKEQGTLPQIATVFGVLTDKINIAKGLDRPDRGDTSKQLEADQIRELLVGYTHAMQELSAAREEEIIDAEIVEQPALPSGS